MVLAALIGTASMFQAGGEDVETYDKKVRWLQSLREFNCAVTIAWTNCDACGGIQSSRHGFLNRARLRAWNRCQVVVEN